MGKPFNYGGQAVMEGVMMRGSRTMAVAVRDPQGQIVMHVEALNEALYRGPLGRLPFVRGLTMLWDALGLGIRGLMFSADVAVGEDEDVSFEGPLAWGTVIVALVLGVGLFFLLPKLTAALFERLFHSTLAGLVVEGAVRLLLFVGYVWLIGHMPDIRRVFAYHGAEHKTINAYEAGAPMTVEGVRPFGTAHARCGTAFLLTLVILSILVFAPLANLPLGWGLAARVLLIPVLAMLAYEAIRFSSQHAHWGWVQVLVAPNLALQRLTTREPDDSMIEVAIAALKRVLNDEGIRSESEEFA
jgi:uncharacterized protein YqhQ